MGQRQIKQVLADAALRGEPWMTLKQIREVLQGSVNISRQSLERYVRNMMFHGSLHTRFKDAKTREVCLKRPYVVRMASSHISHESTLHNYPAHVHAKRENFSPQEGEDG